MKRWNLYHFFIPKRSEFIISFSVTEPKATPLSDLVKTIIVSAKSIALSHKWGLPKLIILFSFEKIGGYHMLGFIVCIEYTL